MVVYKIKRFSKKKSWKNRQVTYKSLDKAKKNPINIEDSDDPIEIASQIRANKLNQKFSHTILEKKIPVLQTSDRNISKSDCFDWENQEGNYISIKPREKTLKAVGVIGASVLAGLGLYHGAKKLYKKYKIARLKKKEQEQNKENHKEDEKN